MHSGSVISRASSAATRGRGGGEISAGGRGRGEARGNEDDAFSMEYDPLTGEPLDLDSKELDVDGKVSTLAAVVSPKCEDKVDYDIMVELVDYIMTTEAREAAKKNAVAVGGSTVGGGNNGNPGSRSSSASGSSSSSASGGGYGNRGGQQQGSWRSGSRGRRGGGVGGQGSNGGRDVSYGEDRNAGEPLGAILIFLPGFAEIDQLVRALDRHPRIGRGASRIFPLHSSLPSHQQRAIFQRMPPGVRKIVVSTNIAETSVSRVGL